MAIVGDEIYDYVIQQINQRQNAHGSGQNGDERTLEELTYLNSKTSWIKFASGVSVSSSKLEDLGFAPGSAEASRLVGNGLAQNYVLYNGISTLTDVGDEDSYRLLPFSENGYEASLDYGIIPTPGIIDLSIKALNRGSLKKATIKLKVQDRSQLSIIDTLYMRLGYTVLLEWGNSVFLDENGNLDTVKETIVERKDLFFNQNGITTPYPIILNAIEEYRYKYCGNYDGMLGKISNFSWTFNNDGSYDVDLTIISWGDVVESLKSNVTANEKTISFVENTPIDAQAGTIVNTRRKDNVIFSLLHAMKIVASNGGKGKDITIDNSRYGNLITSGSAKITNKEQKLEFKAEYTLKSYSYDPSSRTPIKNENLVWRAPSISVAENWKSYRTALSKYPFYYMQQMTPQSYFGTAMHMDTPWKVITTSPETIYSPFSPLIAPTSPNGAFSFQEVITRVNGETSDPNMLQNDKEQTKAPGLDDSMFTLSGEPTIYLSGENVKKNLLGTSFSTIHESWYSNPKKEAKVQYDFLPSVLQDLLFEEKGYKNVKNVVIRWNLPTYFLNYRDTSQQLSDPAMYAGLTSKWGTDDGEDFDLGNKHLTFTSNPGDTDPQLKTITTANKDNDKIKAKIEAAYSAFTSSNMVPNELMKVPQYDPNTGLPQDNYFEFFHRFVATDENAANEANKNVTTGYWNKPLFWSASFSQEYIR